MSEISLTDTNVLSLAIGSLMILGIAEVDSRRLSAVAANKLRCVRHSSKRLRIDPEQAAPLKRLPTVSLTACVSIFHYSTLLRCWHDLVDCARSTVFAMAVSPRPGPRKEWRHRDLLDG